MFRIHAVLACLLIAPLAQAQDQGAHDVGLSVGLGTSNELLELTTELGTTLGTLGSVTYDNSKAGPTFGVHYRIAIKDRWMVMADGQFQRATEDVLIDGVVAGDVAYTYLTVGFGSDYRYISKEKFQMYSGGAVAWTSQSVDWTLASSSGPEDDSEGFFNFQLVAAGFRVGRALAGFAELGFGYRGIVNAGLSYQF